MNNMKKALKVILPIALVAITVTISVCYAVLPGQTRWFFEQAWAMLNNPLPIVGVTALAVLIFLWRVVIATRFGKGALKEIKDEYEAKYAEFEAEKEHYEQELKDMNNKFNELKDNLARLCDVIPNKKVKDLAKEFDYGKDIDSDTEKE